MAFCMVTNTQANLGLLHELMMMNVAMIKNERREMQVNPMMDTSVYPKEIKSCIDRRYENPSDSFLIMLEKVRCYKTGI